MYDLTSSCQRPRSESPPVPPAQPEAEPLHTSPRWHLFTQRGWRPVARSAIPAAMRGIGNDRHESRSATDLADMRASRRSARKVRTSCGNYVPLADRRGFYAREQYPPAWARVIDVIIRSEGFEGARAALEEMLGSGHQVFLCTSPVIGSRWCAQEKLAWIEHHLGRAWLRPTIITSDKTVGDRLQPCVLVDDRPGITGAAIPPWQHVLFDAPYSQGQPGPRLSSWADWRSVIEPVLAAQRRGTTMAGPQHNAAKTPG